MSFEALIYYTLKLTLIAHHRDSLLERKAITKDHCWWCLQALSSSPSSWKTPHSCSHSPPPFSSFSQPCPQSQLSPAWNVNQPTDRVGKRFTLHCLMDRTVSFPKLIEAENWCSNIISGWKFYHLPFYHFITTCKDIFKSINFFQLFYQWTSKGRSV